MKKLLILLFSTLILPISVYASDVYYCVDDAITGFDTSENHKVSQFNEQKFKILIDFENKNITSKEIFFTNSSNKKCVFEPANQSLNCINNYGVAFAISKNDLYFVRSSITPSIGDDPYVAYGTCEKF